MATMHETDPSYPRQMDTGPMIAEREAMTQAQQQLRAKPIEWRANAHAEWFDTNGYGFHIGRRDNNSREPYSAAWGEGDPETFPTLADAKAWCQEIIDGWVRENALITPQSPEKVAELERLHRLINSPEIDAFLRATHIEAVHQVERWGTSHDRAKRPADWFWLVGYLAGKALHAATDGNVEKASASHCCR